MKETVVDGDVPFEEEMTSLVEKVKIQAANTGSEDNVYKQTNESKGIERVEAPVDEVNYQEILDSIDEE